MGIIRKIEEVEHDAIRDHVRCTEKNSKVNREHPIDHSVRLVDKVPNTRYVQYYDGRAMKQPMTQSKQISTCHYTLSRGTAKKGASKMLEAKNIILMHKR